MTAFCFLLAFSIFRFSAFRFFGWRVSYVGSHTVLPELHENGMLPGT